MFRHGMKMHGRTFSRSVSTNLSKACATAGPTVPYFAVDRLPTLPYAGGSSAKFSGLSARWPKLYFSLHPSFLSLVDITQIPRISECRLAQLTRPRYFIDCSGVAIPLRCPAHIAAARKKDTCLIAIHHQSKQSQASTKPSDSSKVA
jgi:hypothetical protein